MGATPKREAGAPKPLAPPLKWAGGKRWLAKDIAKLYAPFSDRRFVEPFGGGLAAALYIRPKKALLNDINPHLINFYRQVKKGLEIDLELKNSKEVFLQYRDELNHLIDNRRHVSKRAAQLFYYLNRTCFNGLCRFNGSGNFNVPYGNYKTVKFLEDFDSYKEAFANWEFACGDFARLELNSKLDFIYADPPYDVPFTQYSKQGFDWEDQRAVARWLAAHHGPVVLSNQATGDIKRLYKEFNFECRRRHAPRMISCDGDRTKAWELIATRNLEVRPVLAPSATTLAAPRLGHILAP